MGDFLDILKLQPDFKVKRSSVPNFREEGSQSPAQFAGDFVDLDRFIKSYHPRTRITKVEIEYNRDGLDVARVTFVDPEYEIYSLLNWNYIWQVGIGYAGAPGSEWATLVGVPQIEIPRFPKDGDPTITLVILSAVVRMTKHHTFGLSSDIAEIRKMASPIRNAIARIARSHGLIPYFGRPKAGDALIEIDTKYRPDDVLDRVFPLQETLNDAQYLDKIKEYLNDWESKKDKDKPQHEVQALEDDEYRWGQLGDKLIMAKWKRDVWDHEFGLGGKKIPVFQYKYGNMALLEFMPRISKVQKENEFQAYTINKQTGETEQVAVSGKGKIVEDIVPLNLGDSRLRKETENLRQNEVKKDFLTLLSVGPDRSEAILDLSRLWEMKGLNIEGEAELLGFPKLRAGMLVGFSGLGKAPDVAHGSSQEQKIFSLNRIYIVERATHVLDARTGKYRVRVLVSSSDSEKYDMNALFEAIATLDAPVQGKDGSTFFDAEEAAAQGATEARP